MKGTFQHTSYLNKVRETIEKHEPYAAIVVSTTGIDNSEFSGHSPIRVFVQQYVYDESLRDYKPSEYKFDEMIQAPEDAVKYACDKADKKEYDVFNGASIDRRKYLEGKGVLEQEEFARRFNLFMKGIKDDTLVIANGGYEFVGKYLDKINCGTDLAEINAQNRVINQSKITADYFQVRNVQKDANLRELYAYLSKKDTVAPIEGTGRRAGVIHYFMSTYGGEEGLLAADYEKYRRQMDADIIEDMSRKGRAKYENASYIEKLESLTEQKSGNSTVIDPDKIRDRDADTDITHLFKAFTGEMGNKGVIVMQAATTGFNFHKPYPQKVGEPIQFSAVAFEIKNGVIDCKHPVKTLQINIQASDKAVSDAEARRNLDPNSKEYFDAFAHTGLDAIKYQQNDKSLHILSPDEAKTEIRKFFSECDPDEYAIITNGRNGDKSTTGHALSQLGNFAVTSKPFIDFTQAIKEYCYLVYDNADVYDRNVLLDPDKYNGDFKLESVASAKGSKDIKSTSKRCMFTAMAAAVIAKQQADLFPDLIVQKEEEEIKIDLGLPPQKKEPEIEEPVAEPEQAEEKEEQSTPDNFAGVVLPSAPQSGVEDKNKERQAIKETESKSPMEQANARLSRFAGREMPEMPSGVSNSPVSSFNPEADAPERFGGKPFRPSPEEYAKQERERRPLPSERFGGMRNYEPAPSNSDLTQTLKALTDMTLTNKALTEQISEQSKVILEQNKQMAEQNSILQAFTLKLFEVVKEYNGVLQQVLQTQGIERDLSMEQLEQEAVKVTKKKGSVGKPD